MQHPADRAGPGAARLAEAASRLSSSPSFFVFCLCLVVAVFAVHIVEVGVRWQLFAGDCMTAVTLLLLALLKNSELRAERAVQRKLDAIAAAMPEAQEGPPGKAYDDLRSAIRPEDEI
ncbi:low affinity iron permease family protein [Streptomyces sp. NPDC059165]|uniref:low affinity iron permease family protein n=1 Tax=Streptomyces sp. NPDC059165 TaxID=3346751 RepID=UPI0036829A0E